MRFGTPLSTLLAMTLLAVWPMAGLGQPAGPAPDAAPDANSADDPDSEQTEGDEGAPAEDAAAAESSATPEASDEPPGGQQPDAAPGPQPGDAEAPAAGEPGAQPAQEPAQEPVEAEAGAEPMPGPPGDAAPAPSPMLSGSEDATVPTPADLEERLTQEVPEDFDGNDTWTAPTPVLTLHGYMRMRGELMDTFWLGREPIVDVEGVNRVGQGPDPFSRFRPLERRRAAGSERAPADLSCVDETTNSDGTCDVDTLQHANMRLRLTPQLNLSEDVRVKMTFDVFDNLIAGTPPATFYGAVPLDAMGNPIGRPDAETTVFASTDLPAGGNFSDSIVARRAWAEVRNRNLGELRFGRMPQHWGLGMYYNAGNRLDDDFSTDIDRVLGVTELFGLYLLASYDFVAEGFVDPEVDRPDIDQSQLDDVDQFTFSVARRHSPEELEASLERGELILNGGVQFSLRNQDSLYLPDADPMDSPLREIEATHYTTDLWALLRYRGLRIEAEATWVTGSMDNLVDGRGDYDISQIGYALETELRLLDEQLGLYMFHGLASGDSDVEGLSADADYIDQLGEHDNTISTFRFHPSYRIDLILWRNLMRQVTGAWYIRPGISYDFLRSDFGELFGARLDVIYSRATAFVQTWGNDPNLGLELNASVYWRSEDGPDLLDGYHAQVQYGVLFPMRGLAFYHEDTDLDTAQTLRLILGVVF